MQITLYLADNDEQLKYFTSFLTNESKKEKHYKCIFGYCIEFECEMSFLSELCRSISVFALEFHLREAVFSKIYDEYIYLDITDAGMLFSKISQNITDTVLFEKLSDLFQKSSKICVDSFIIFNIKPIMQNIYEKVDFYAEQMLIQKEKEAFRALINTYPDFQSDFVQDVMTEFSSDND